MMSIDRLRAQLKGRVIEPGDPDYDNISVSPLFAAVGLAYLDDQPA
jgi:hypothetical protein